MHDGEDIANKMLEQLTKHNIVEKRLSELEQQRILKWIKHDATFCLFPFLTPSDIENITFGNIKLIYTSNEVLFFQDLIRYVKQNHIFTID